MFKYFFGLVSFFYILSFSTPAFASTSLFVLGPPVGRAAFEELIKSYEKSHSDVKIQITYAASAITMATVKSGASVDVAYIPLNLEEKDESFFDSKMIAFRNHTEIVVSKKASSKIKTPKDLGNKGIRLGGGTSGSVVETYQTKMLTNLSKSFGADLVEKYKENVVTTNAVSSKFLDQMDSDAIDAAILVSSEIPAGKYVVLDVPTDMPAINTYVGAVVKSSKNIFVAKDFLAFTISSSAQAAWKLSHFDVK